MRIFISLLVSIIFVCLALFSGWVYFEDSTNRANCSPSETPKSAHKKTTKVVKKVAGEEITFDFDEVEDSYFDDALFIGDSRTVGLGRYSSLSKNTEAEFFAKVGLTAARAFNVTNSEMGEYITLLDKLKTGSYKKIYIMFGVNELAENLEVSAAEFCELLLTVKKYQPDALIFIEANLHVGKNRSESWEYYSNDRLELYNKMLASNADYETIFYLDINEVYDDEEGNLGEEYTGDELHLYEHQYEPWVEYLKTHAVVK